MSTFTWNNLTVTVGEVSRAVAIACARHFDLVLPICKTYDEAVFEAQWLLVEYAPVIIKHHSKEPDTVSVWSKGEREFDIDGDDYYKTVKIAQPLTREIFDSLPMSLSRKWITAAVTSNNWWVDDLLKIIGLASIPPLLKTSEPKSESGPSNVPATLSPATKTTGA